MTTKTYSPAEVATRLQSELSAWRYEDGHLRRDLKTADWLASMAVANRISDLAEAADHHPDLLIAWGRVQISLATHDAGGITNKDFALASAIEGCLGVEAGTPAP